MSVRLRGFFVGSLCLVAIAAVMSCADVYANDDFVTDAAAPGQEQVNKSNVQRSIEANTLKVRYSRVFNGKSKTVAFTQNGQKVTTTTRPRRFQRRAPKNQQSPRSAMMNAG